MTDADVPLRALLGDYDAHVPLSRAATIPASWYVDSRIERLERRAVFGASWQVVARLDQLSAPGCYVTADVAGEPIVIVRGQDQVLRAFFNVCRHHAAAVLSSECGLATSLRCPYHGWTYGLDGALLGTPDFDGVEAFDRAANGLRPAALSVWAGFVFVRLDEQGESLSDFLGDLPARVDPERLASLRFLERRSYELECNWKVFVDNYLDGGYHVPHLHKGLDAVLDYASYTIENGPRYCLQSSPLGGDSAAADTRAVRGGDRALYVWLYPNFMLNVYEGVMDTNLVLPLGPSRTRVVFDFYFADVSEAARARNRASMDLAERIQTEDVAICESVQRGLGSRAYERGRLSVRREAGEHLFHRLLAADLRRGAA